MCVRKVGFWKKEIMKIVPPRRDDAATMANGIPNPIINRATTNMATVLEDAPAPTIMIALPRRIADLLPRPSDTITTNGSETIAPREYIDDMRPSRVERGLWKTASPNH
ncbi:hypothetical protein Agabi119p4_4996 [Agaricus bisporus var. burnettii]|uniref:Uncharacterized protein n=1 Tax=Agaricus bisporus var. burnettii TaxID=192524 RepID=A0A8H7F4I6_AGABI|nr:hypothetical protein Agabi119p4_4996 [Agaricus bisporus var. burnettii]